jgi:hypothetical protein
MTVRIIKNQTIYGGQNLYKILLKSVEPVDVVLLVKN